MFGACPTSYPARVSAGVEPASETLQTAQKIWWRNPHLLHLRNWRWWLIRWSRSQTVYEGDWDPRVSLPTTLGGWFDNSRGPPARIPALPCQTMGSLPSPQSGNDCFDLDRGNTEPTLKRSASGKVPNRVHICSQFFFCTLYVSKHVKSTISLIQLSWCLGRMRVDLWVL